MLPAQQGYDRAITVFSPDGRLYQVEYAIETVRRGTIAVGVKCKDGIVIAVEEKPRKLQISETAQKIFQIDDHVGVAAAGYIPDARSQVDNARFFSQSNKMIYDAYDKVFKCSMLLKQGFYNYKYVVIENNNQLNEGAVSGNFYQTENNYKVIAYYRDLGKRYDRIIGFGEGSSVNISN